MDIKNVPGSVWRYSKKVEADIRTKLNRYPLVYAFVGGVGVVLFWRGVWHMTDFAALFFFSGDTVTSIDWSPGVDSLISLIIGIVLLLSTGLFVSELVGKEILASGLKKEEVLTKKTEVEVEEETTELSRVEKEIHHIAEEIKEMDSKLHAHANVSATGEKKEGE